MKNKNYYVLCALFVVLFFLQSCKKDSSGSTITNSQLNASNLNVSSSLYTGIGPLLINDFTCFNGLDITAVSNVQGTNGYKLYEIGLTSYNPVTPNTGWVWNVIPGEATSITSDYYDNIYITNALGDIFTRGSNSSNPWRQLPGQASVIRCNNANSGSPFVMYCLGTTMADNNGYHIYKWNTSTGNWDLQFGTAVKLAVEPNGTAWCINASQTIFRSDSNGDGGWTAMPGRATEIAAGGGTPSVGVVYCIGNVAADNNGNGIFKWINNNWTQVVGSAVKITVSIGADVLVENNKGNFFIKESSQSNFSPF